MRRERLEHLAKRGDQEAIKALARLDLRRSTIVRRAESPATFLRRGQSNGGGGRWAGTGNGYKDGGGGGVGSGYGNGEGWGDGFSYGSGYNFADASGYGYGNGDIFGGGRSCW